MAYISLYRKYRPHTFAEVVGQEIIIKILKNSIINNKIGHAYIFSGPRGTGKTSIAKIFAKAVNCLNSTGDVCDSCEVCKMNFEEQIDIVEIDAASNNGIDEIREIRNNIKLLPTVLKYKVYIIDEVHMLSTSAFNALLKTLEEPPSHAIFILATTEINKIPTTVLSRCQKFDFKKINNNDIFNRLKYICECENIKLDDDILSFIAELSDGGLRDAINLLDQVNSINKDNIMRTDVLNLIGSIDDNSIFSLLDSVLDGNISEVIKNVDDFYKNNRDFNSVVYRLENIIKDIIIFNNTNGYFNKEYEDKLYNYSKVDVNDLLSISQQLFELSNELKKSSQQMIIAEIYFLKITLFFSKNSNKLTKSEENVDKIEQNEEINEQKEIKVEENTAEVIIDDDEKNILINNTFVKANKALKNEFIEKYDQINEYITSKDFNSITNLLKKANPEVVSDTNVIFTFKNNFEVILFDKNIDLVNKLLKKIYDIKYNIVAIDEEKWEKIKKEYINNVKSGIKYEYIDLKKKNVKSNKKSSKLENSLNDIFGEEYVREE